MAENIISDIIDIVNENFYLMDVSFDDKNCWLLFKEIYNVYYLKYQPKNFRKDILKYIKQCTLKIDKDENYDYHLFLDNLFFLPLDELSIKQIYNNVIQQVESKVY